MEWCWPRPVTTTPSGYSEVEWALCNGALRFWDPVSGNCIMTKPHNGSQVNSMALTGDKGMLGVAGYQHIKIYDLKTATPSWMPVSVSSNQVAGDTHTLWFSMPEPVPDVLILRARRLPAAP